MDERLKPALELYQEKIERLEVEIIEKKKQLNTFKILINQLLLDSGEQPKYSDLEMNAEPIPQKQNSVPNSPDGDSMQALQIKTGEFYGKQLSKAVRIILERGGGTVDFDDIIVALNRGGFNAKDEKWVRNVILKNKHIALLPDKRHFIYVPGGKAKRVKPSESQKKEELGDRENDGPKNK